MKTLAISLLTAGALMLPGAAILADDDDNDDDRDGRRHERIEAWYWDAPGFHPWHFDDGYERAPRYPYGEPYDYPGWHPYPPPTWESPWEPWEDDEPRYRNWDRRSYPPYDFRHNDRWHRHHGDDDDDEDDD
jgi:hypothetical protein